MKKTFLKASGLVMLIAVILGWALSSVTNAAPHLNIGGSDNYYDYHSPKLNVDINMPADWHDKVSTKEDDQTVTVSYNNPGGQPVFLYSLTKVDEKTWLNIKDELTGIHLVGHKDGQIYFIQFTDKTSIKGANAKEFKAMVANLNDVLTKVKVG